MGRKEILLDKNQTCLPNDYVLTHASREQKLFESTSATFKLDV